MIALTSDRGVRVLKMASVQEKAFYAIQYAKTNSAVKAQQDFHKRCLKNRPERKSICMW
jgi:hypothetical protein